MMAGQGITVSIQAKIEGWQEQIKQIQNAMKNIKPGSDISKGLIKDLQQVNDMVNNLGKNMNQRLTSDSQITGFVDKIMQVEEVFGRLGTSMSHISFGDINPEYITAGFKDLLSTLEQANNALGQGMESSFQNAIANSKTLQKEFERMKIDPKTMNIDAVREALAERGKSLEKDVNDGLKKLTDFEKGLEKLKSARDELTARDKFLGKDANATAQSLLIGHQLPTKGTILDADELDKQISFFRSNLLKAGFTPTQLGRIIPDLESVMKAGHWDEMPSKFAEYLREAQNRTRNSLEKASQDYGAAVLQHQKMVGAQNHLSSLRFNNTQAQNDVTRILSDTVPKDTKSLRDVVNNIKQQLETAVTSGFKGLGSTLFGSSQQGMQDASAAMKDYSAALDQVRAKEQAVSKVQGVVQRYFSIYAAVRMVSKGIRSMMNNIKELDKTITEIAIVTKMDQNDLWGQMPQYTKLAKNYAASISGVYKVSQLYYQQGLGQQDVMALTEQTLKMARISGLDYAEATDYMTNAVRSFKMEMTDAATVVDVYSAVAASSASSVTELATAMSKTASSAAAVGSSFENTTAMLAVMIEATRESPENIGSAMKSIISRYGELKENKTGIDEEGEEYSLNKVDKALQTVGISIHDANGEFRDFDDVIFELAEKWNTIDKNTQRYIATVMAGNRQQSRFLALVSSTERLKEESEKAANSEDASQLQFLKTMDSIEAKTQQFQTSLQSLYTSSGLENLYKGLLDFGNEFATTLENISSKQGLVGAIGNVGASFTNMATLATTGFGLIKTKLTSTKLQMETFAKNDVIQNKIDQNEARIKELAPVPHTYLNNGKIEETPEYTELKQLQSENAKLQQEKSDNNVYQSSLMRQQQKMAKIQGAGIAASAAGMALSAWANSIDINENRGLKGGLTIGSSALQGLGTGLMVGASAGGPIGALVGVLTALPGILSGAGMLTETMAERVQHLEKDITDTKNQKLKSKDELKTLEDYKKKYDELSKSQYESAEKKQEFMELSNSIAASYPELIKSMDAEGNYILNMAEGYERLAEAKRSAYQESLIDSIAAETAGLKDADYVLKNVYGQAPLQNKRAWHGLFDTSSIESLMGIDYKDFTEEEKTQVANLLTNRETANQVFSNLKDDKGNFIDFYSFGPNLAAQLSTVYQEFINKINENKDYSTAVSEIQEQLGDSYTWLIEAFGTDVYKELKTRKDLPEYQEKLVDNATSAYNTELVNLLADQTEETFDITSNDIQKSFAKEQIGKEFTEWKSSLDTETLTNPEKWKEAVKNFYNKYDAVWYKIEYESDLISGLSDDINDFYQDMGKHTKADIRKLFPEGELTDIQQQQLKWLEDIFDLDFEDAFADYNNWLKQENISKFKVKDYSDKVGADYLTQIQSQYKNIISNTGLSEKQITDQVAALNDITDFITDQNLDFDTRNTLLTKYSAADFTSLNGIYNFVDTLSNLDIDLDLTSLIAKVQSLGDVLAVNFEAEIDSYYDAIESSVSDFNKAIKSVTEGTDLKTAREIADKMGKSLSDFQVIDGKFYFDDIEALKKAYIKENDEYIADVQKNVNERYSTLESLSEVNFTDVQGNKQTIELKGTDLISGKQDLQALKDTFRSADSKTGFLQATNITFTEFTKYYEEFQKAIDEGFEGNLLTFMQNKVQNTLDESGQAILQYLEQNTASSQIKSGNLKGFLQTIGKIQTDEQIEKQVAQSTAEWQGELLNNYDTIVNDLMTQKRKSAKKEAYSYASQMQSEFNKETASGNQALYEQIYQQEKDAWSDIYLIREEQEQIAKEQAAAAGSADWKSYYKKLVAGKLVTKQAEFDRMVKDSTQREFDDQVANRTFDYEQVLQAKYSELVGQDDNTIRAEAEKEALEMMSVSDETWQKIVEKHPDLTIQRLSEILSLDAKGVEALEESEKQILQDIRDSAAEEMINKIMSGDYSDLKDGNEQFIGELYEYATSSAKTVMSSLTTALGGGENKIKITVGNKSLLEQLKASSIITNKELIIGDLAEIDVAALKNKSDNEFITLVNSLQADSKTKQEWIQSFLDVKYPNKVEQVTSLAGKEKTISRSDFQTYLDAFNKKNKDFESYAEDYGLAFNQYTNSWDIDDYDKYIQALKDDAQLLGEGTEARREADIAIDAADRQRKNKEAQDQVKAFEDVVKNYDHVTDDQMTTLQTVLKDDWYLVEQMLTPTGAGEYQLDIAKLRNNLDQLNLSDKVKESILQMFTSTADDYLKNISSATDLLTKGTTSQTDIQDFKNKAKALGMEISDSAFHYDDILQAWTLDPAVLRSFIQAQGQQLIDAGLLSLDEVTQYVNDNVTKTLLGAIDIKGFLEAEDKSKSGQARKKFVKQLSDAGIDSSGIDGIINTLIEGGGAAVSLMQSIAQLKGEELTSADIEQAYRAQVSEIENSLDQITFGPGGIVSGYAVTILDTLAKEGKAEIVHLDANNAVIKSITDIGAAYAEYYKALAKSGEATLEALNEAKAKVLETQDGRYKEQSAIDALGDAAGMTYTAFAAILSDAGIEMTDDIIRDYIESLGGNKMRIKDFAAFARVMKWDYDSEEYTSAFKSYNDSLIERNKQVKNNIEEEIKGLEDIKPGDWLNLTETEKAIKKAGKDNSKQIAKASRELYKAQANDTQNAAARWQQELEKLQSEDVLYSLNQSLIKFGAYLDDGILKIDDNANILGIAQTLISTTEQAGIEISAEMQDMISNMIKSYSEAIAKGIEGGMTNTEKEDLIKKAYNLGFEPEDLQFNETIDGLELTQQSAIQVYKALSQLDRKQSVKALSALTKKLEENNEKYKTTTSLLSHIAELEDQINSGKYSDERLEALRAELEVARQINAERLISGEADWNFMNNNALPGSFTNAIEYWQGWASAAKQLTDAGTKGQIDPAALATMFQHVYELAEATGEDLTFMGLSTADQSFTGLLDMLGNIVQIDAQTGQALLTADKLKTLGIDLSLGAQGISQGVQDAANKYAKMNGDQLKNIHEFYDDLANMKDALDEQHIDWNDYFDSGEFDYSKFKKDLSNKKGALDSFNNFADKVTVENTKLSTLLENGEITGATAKAMQSIFTMMSAEDWDATTGYQDIAAHLASSGFQGALDLGDMEFEVRGNHVLMRADKDQEWKDTEGKPLGKDAKAAFEAMNEKDLAEYAKEFEAYKSSTDTSKTEIEIPGTEYKIKVDGDHFILVNGNDEIVNGNYSTPEEALAASREDRIDSLSKEYKDLIKNQPKYGTPEEVSAYMTNAAHRKGQINKELKALRAMSDAGYTEWVQSGLSETGKWATEAKQGKGAHGYITADARSKLISGKYTAESLKQEAINLWKDSGLSNDQAAAEFKIKTGIDLDPNEDLEKIDWNDYINQTELTQAAADVAQGISAAFDNEKTSASISSSIKTGITDALSEVATGEDGSVKVTFEGIIKEGTIPPEEVKDETRTVTYNPANYTPPDIPDIERKVIYTPEFKNPNGNSGGIEVPEIPGVVATGNIGLAHAKGTLMGELGPELVVSKGRYFVVGQSGPEMVNLADDAIVFNHLQTKSLLEKGTSSTRGRAITNEQNAVAYATGSIHGGFAHSGSTRKAANDTAGGSPIWNLGFNAIKNLNKSDNDKPLKSFLKELERWYNWLQQIAHVEKEITYQETLRSKYQNSFNRTGADYYNSQKESLKLLSAQLDIEKDLVQQRKNYLAQRQQELENSPFSTVYRFDERGQIQYQEGAFENFSKLFGTNDQGIPYYTAEQQYDALVAMGMEEYMKYDNSGQEIDKSKDGWQATAVQAFYDKMEKEREEFQNLHDDIMDGEEKIVELQDNQNQILHDIQDNQIAVEQKVLKAVEESRQRAIDDAKDERDAIEKSANTLIDGLNKQLDKERTLYQNQQSADELAALQRRLGILQRSGGSASEIADLQSQIQEKQYDKYFDTQEQQIQAIQDASDAELERLDNQITLMEETLAYEKEFGLLWNEVDEVLKQSPEQIATFIQQNTSEYWGASLEELNKKIQEDLFQIDQFKQFQNVDGGMQALINAYGGNTENTEEPSEEQQNEDQPIEGGGGGSKYAENVAGTWRQGEDGRWWYEHNEADENGKKYTTNNWEKINDKWYHFDEEGWMQTGWFKDQDGQWYYLDDTKGANEGAMLSNTTRALDWNGKVQNHTFNENGVWTGASDIQNGSTKSKYTEFTVVGKDPDTGEEIELATYDSEADAKKEISRMVEEKQGTTQKVDDKYNYAYVDLHVNKKAHGGYVNHGLYELGELGTETVLTASQTKVLRDNILSNRPDSLINLLKSYNEAYRGLSQNAYDSISNTTANMVNIERAEVNLQIEKLADDYDSKRAANTIMDEMLRIASKTKANNSVRR